MSGPIQVIPAGLLGFLNLKSQGRNPGDLLETIQPQLDWLTWAFKTQDTSEVIASGAPLNVIGYTAFTGTPVPDREWHYVNWVTLTMVTGGATEDVTFALGWRESIAAPGSTRRHFLTGYNRVFNGSGQTFNITARDFWMPPGSQFLVHVQNPLVTTGTITMDLVQRYTRLPI